MANPKVEALNLYHARAIQSLEVKKRQREARAIAIARYQTQWSSDISDENWNHVLSHLRRQRNRGDGVGSGVGPARARGAFHLVFPAHPADRDAAQHPLSRSGSVAVSVVRISALRSGAGHAHGRSGGDLRARPAACALRDSSFGERDAGAADAGLRPQTQAAQTSLCHHAAWDRHHAGGGRSLVPADHAVFHRSERWSDVDLAVSGYADPGDSEFRELRYVSPHTGDHEAPDGLGEAGREDIGTFVELPSGEADSGCH